MSHWRECHLAKLVSYISNSPALVGTSEHLNKAVNDIKLGHQ